MQPDLNIAAGTRLKLSPPRVPRNALNRERLSLVADPFSGASSVILHAPGGYGKTSLLAQWRRECLATGAAVAWLSSSESDDPEHLLQEIVLSYRQASLRPTFGHTLLDATGTYSNERIAALLAEIAQVAVDSVLIVDEADRLPPEARDALCYILRNLPGNLRVFLALRSMAGFEVDDLLAYGQCHLVGAPTLGFQLDETVDLLHQRLGDSVDPDLAAQLQEVSSGWPLGLQMIVSAQLQGRSASQAVDHFAAGSGDLHDGFVSLLMAQLDADQIGFLTRIAVLDDITPDLCDAVLGSEDAAERLERIAASTPVVQLTERGEWMRLHGLARSALREQFAELSEAERNRIHERAADWLAAHGMTSAAARHALAGGDMSRALNLAERSLYRSVMTQGQISQMRNWLAVIPEAELDRRPKLLLAAAWALAVSERHDEAREFVDRILSRPDVDDSLRCECALILGGAAVFADDPDRFAELHDPWALDPPLSDPLLLQIHANRFAFRALLEGEPTLARLRQQRAPRLGEGASPRHLSRWNDFIIGLSYIWEGQVRLAERIIRPALLQSEGDLGRRDTFSSMLAALLAAAVWERDQPDDAQVLLADRMDVLEKSGLPEALLLAYRTLGRIAASRGDEHRALEQFGAMHAIGVHRGLPRLCLVSIAEQIRMHARGLRAQTCQTLLSRLEALLEDAATPVGPIWRRSVSVPVELARGYSALAAQDWRAALEPFERANTVAREYRQERAVIETLGLRALVLERRGDRNAEPLLREALELADSYGLERVFIDAHPLLGNWVQRLTGASGQEARESPAEIAPAPAPSDTVTVNRSSALTPKEWDVLELLARSLSNKEIGRALDIHEETVKWHVKNLFAKLDAGSRKHVVSRAKLMGFLN